MIATPTITQPPLPLAIQAFLAGILVALALLSILAYRPLRDRLLSHIGLFGLAAAAAWMAFSGLGATFLPDLLTSWVHPLALILGGICLLIWERVTTSLMAESPGAMRLGQIRRSTSLVAFAVACTAVIPWPPTQRLAGGILGLLAPFLALLTLRAGLRARREGLPMAGALAASALAMLVCCGTLWAQTAGWIGLATSMTILQLGLVFLSMALGWAMLSRMAELRRSTELAQATQLAAAEIQAHELEALVAQRNAELSARLKDLGETRRSSELANLGLRRAMEQLEEAASTDRLTGAWNRRRFEEAVMPEIALAHRRRDPLALLMFDLDHFKRVNDTHGHGAGDAVLAGTAATVRKYLRASDSLIRWGGEEFLVMAPATRLEGALGIAEKLRAAVAAIDFPGVGSVTISLGVSEYSLGEGLEAWIERTDQALYRAKDEGRNRAVAAPMPLGPDGELIPERSLLEMIWEETYESGNALIDAQHQRLFRLASSLMSVLTEHRPITEVSLRLETLLAHTAQHFHDEEALLRAAHYQDVAEHAAIHATLLTRAWKLQADVKAGQMDFGQLVTFLALDLVKGHILGEDRGYFSHLVAVIGPEAMPPAGA